MRFGLVLSGGGIKGAAHIGVLKALEENDIKIDYISGASSGSIVASLYAIGYNADEIFTIFKQYSSSLKYFEFKNIIKLIYGIIFKRKIIITGLSSGKKLEKLMNKVCKEKNVCSIKDVNMPLIISTTSLQDKNTYIFSSVETIKKNTNKHTNDIPLPKCVRASCSFPGIFEPTIIKNTQYIDGGIKENHPWKELKKIGAEKVLCINFKENNTNDKKYTNMFEIIDESLNMVMDELSKYELYKIDMIIDIKTNKVKLLDDSQINELYQTGYKEMIKQIPTLKQILKQ